MSTIRKKRKENYAKYRNGADGLIKWAEERVWVSIYPIGSELSVWVPLGSASLPKTEICPAIGRSYREIWCEVNPATGRSYKFMWEKQKEVLREALRMVNGRFVFMLIVLCWPRGEGKSFLAVLIQLWKWCCWPKQDIKLCANSKDQTDHAHLKIAKEIILNSPKLLNFIGKKNVLENEIRMRDSTGQVISRMEIISSASGIFSNINGYAFSEIFELKNETFWNKVDGNLRNIPLAFGVIDTTVSSKEHFLYSNLYLGWKNQSDPLTYFSYRKSEHADYRDYWNPHQTERQLASYKSKQPLLFAKQFQNLWSAGTERVFSSEQVEAINYFGAERQMNHERVIELVRRKSEILHSTDMTSKSHLHKILKDVYVQDKEMDLVESLLWPVSSIYRLKPCSAEGSSVMTDAGILEELGEMLDTDWAIIAGIDRAQPMKRRTNARTIYVSMAKGLIGSRSNPSIGLVKKNEGYGPEPVKRKSGEYMISGPTYVYLYLHIANILDHSLEGLKREILLDHQEFSGIDTIGAESWGIFDLVPWAEELEIDIKIWQPSINRQAGAFTELFSLVNDGRIKCPPVAICGSKGNDILIEEYSFFDHDPDKRWFGSPEKGAKYGVQDDLMYASGWGIYGGREMTVDKFRSRGKTIFLGTIIQPTGLLGKWL